MNLSYEVDELIDANLELGLFNLYQLNYHNIYTTTLRLGQIRDYLEKFKDQDCSICGSEI